MEPLLSVQGLRVAFPGEQGPVAVVRGADLEIAPGEFVGLVGESGSGKTMTALAVVRLLPPAARITAGDVIFDGVDLLRLPARELRGYRGRRIGFIFQEPTTALNPVFSIGSQIAESIRIHYGASRREALERAADLLERVAIPEPRKRLKSYPHELSGGQRQRVMIAIALAARPDLVIADEPTTALDVTVQAEILDLLHELREELGLAVLLITHDLAVVAQTCDRVFVMYAGEMVEEARVGDLFASPGHPYTRGLMSVVPRLGDGSSSERRLPVIRGQIPTPGALPPGCVFAPRCDDAFGHCSERRPQVYPVAADHRASCFLHDPDAPRDTGAGAGRGGSR